MTRRDQIIRFNQIDAVDVLAGSLLLLLTVTAILWPIIGYDDWYYHLPFSSRLWDIGGAQSFQLSEGMERRWVGFPKVWEWLQGLFWWGTGSLRGAILPQLALTCGYFAVVSSTLRVRPAMVILAFCTCPMLLIHHQALYLDLPAALSLAIGFFLLVGCVESERFRWTSAAGAVFFLGLAGNIKVTALAAEILIVLVWFVVSFISFQLGSRTIRALAFGLLAILAGSLTALSDLQRTGNPIYPLELKIAGTTLVEGPEDPLTDANPPRYLFRGREFGTPRPVAFLLSVTELDWTMRGVAPTYDLHSDSGNYPRRGPPSQTGGWGWLFSLVNGGVLLLQLACIRREQDPLQRRLVLAVSAIAIVTAFAPRSHELRYSLYLPLMIMPVNLRYAMKRMPAQAVTGLLIVMMSYALAQALLSRESSMLVRPPLPGMAEYPARPAAMVAALSRTGRYCDNDPLLFRYSTALTGEPGLLSQQSRDCREVSRRITGAL